MAGTHLANTFTCQPCALRRGLPTNRAVRHQHWRVPQRIALPTHHQTLARCFGEAGYHTGYIGKWHLAEGDPVPQSSAAAMTTAGIQRAGVHFHTLPHRNVRQRSQPVFMPGYRVDALTDAAIHYIAEPAPVAVFPFSVFPGAAPPETTLTITCPPTVTVKVLHRALAAAGPGSPGRFQRPAHWRVFRAGEAPGRSPGKVGRRAEESEPAGGYHPAVSCLTTQPFQNPQRRIQARLPRGLRAHPAMFTGPGFASSGQVTAAGQPG